MVRKKIVGSSQKLRITIKNIEEKSCKILVSHSATKSTIYKEYLIENEYQKYCKSVRNHLYKYILRLT